MIRVNNRIIRHGLIGLVPASYADDGPYPPLHSVIDARPVLWYTEKKNWPPPPGDDSPKPGAVRHHESGFSSGGIHGVHTMNMPNPETATSEELDEWVEANEAKLESGIKMIREALKEANNDMRPSGYIEMARLAKTLLEVITETGEAPEYMNECRVNAVTLGEFLLQNIGHSLDHDTFDKRTWLEVAEVIGPDHAQVLYRAAVFTTKVA